MPPPFCILLSTIIAYFFCKIRIKCNEKVMCESFTRVAALQNYKCDRYYQISIWEGRYLQGISKYLLRSVLLWADIVMLFTATAMALIWWDANFFQRMQVNTTHTIDGRPFYYQVLHLAVDIYWLECLYIPVTTPFRRSLAYEKCFQKSQAFL